MQPKVTGQRLGWPRVLKPMKRPTAQLAPLLKRNRVKELGLEPKGKRWSPGVPGALLMPKQVPTAQLAPLLKRNGVKSWGWSRR